MKFIVLITADNFKIFSRFQTIPFPYRKPTPTFCRSFFNFIICLVLLWNFRIKTFIVNYWSPSLNLWSKLLTRFCNLSKSSNREQMFVCSKLNTLFWESYLSDLWNSWFLFYLNSSVISVDYVIKSLVIFWVI